MNLADRIVHMERGRIESNVVVAERLFVREGLRQSPAFAAHPARGAAEDRRRAARRRPPGPAGARRTSSPRTPGRVEVYEPGAEIIREGDPVNEHSKFYLIRRGTVEVLREADGGRSQKVAEIGPGAVLRRGGAAAWTSRGTRPCGRPSASRCTPSIAATFDRYKTVSRPFIDRILENFRAVEGGG